MAAAEGMSYTTIRKPTHTNDDISRLLLRFRTLDQIRALSPEERHHDALRLTDIIGSLNMQRSLEPFTMAEMVLEFPSYISAPAREIHGFSNLEESSQHAPLRGSDTWDDISRMHLAVAKHNMLRGDEIRGGPSYERFEGGKHPDSLTFDIGGLKRLFQGVRSLLESV